MRHRKFTFKIGRTSAHRRSLLANAVCSLFKSGRIKTTIPKAKQIRRLAEKTITLGKKGTLHARRIAISRLRQPDVVAEVFSEIAPKYEGRQGGYTRILRLGRRIGDAAELCFLELVEVDAVVASADGEIAVEEVESEDSTPEVVSEEASEETAEKKTEE
ncbi:MAG: 50S ribosomal protein L17 [Lentisphaeria bacterium]|nr:50S ribosomal protein L17 [Lentisphaeria bacterium]